jgi:hypothetical protein
MSNCQRCGSETPSLKMSYFNTDMMCEKCNKTERLHPLFEKAKREEMIQCQNGNMNFEGIGLPNDLKR